MINIFLFVLCLVNRSTSHNVDDGIRVKKDLQSEKLINNSSPIKSIHTKSGYIVDCIDIYKQPAFDHPLLKNHKLQRKPSFQTILGKTRVNISRSKPVFGLEKIQCPIGTVPIQRTTEDDLVRAKSFVINDIHMLSQGIRGSHVAAVTLGTTLGTSIYGIPRGSFHGVSGINSVYNPRVMKYQTSSSIMWAPNGPIDVTNLIAVGWHVAPQLYNDDKTHVYVVWTRNNFKSTGCYNLQCPGFVQTSKTNILGAVVDHTSVHGGEVFEIPFSISQDLVTKNWWITIGNTIVGYFPASLFSNMASADQVGWGGRTTTSVSSPSPPMGSGYLPLGGTRFVDSCYFRNVLFKDDSRKDQAPEIDVVVAFSDKPKCYVAEYNGYRKKIGGYSLNFGGPGGNCGD